MKIKDIFLVLMAAFVLTGCTSHPVAVPDDTSVVGLYQLRALDPLVISLRGIPQEKQIESIIDERGTITLPYVDAPVQAAGMTTSELERKIQSIYTDGKIYRNITVNIATTAKIYYMEGEVRKPQEYLLNRRITLLQAIAAASGYTEYANPKNVTITRNGKIMKFNTVDLEKHPERDVPVEAGDRIKVNRSVF
ncbi:MAG TPA: polysaccharide biosynthesis/export family protein [Pontiellaceae bacterium]|nr:polysaccharide biosynthesis/export family protein [Pontiellaceae bacterium]HPR82476.1 polysaccharide biosynthesis/export family protein [Pontiellaceae bacterium]